MTEINETLQIVGTRDQFPKVSLIKPATSSYLMMALEVDHRPPIGFFLQSRRKRALISSLKSLATQLGESHDVLHATVFKALIVPPGRGALLKERPHVDIARFDIVLLVEFTKAQATEDVTASPQWISTLELTEKMAHKTKIIEASNIRHIGPVDHSREGIFLFNYFYADNLDINLKVWNYTAGWFQDQTGLDNSIVLLPKSSPDLSYTIINHCRWDSLGDILPELLFNKTFRPFVLANFEKNHTAAMPILYRLA